MAGLNTLLLNPLTWDLLLDSNGNIAVAGPPYSQAQDAASAIKLFLGEYWFDTTQGIPYFLTTLGQAPPIQLVKAQAVNAALTVPGVVAAQCFISSVTNRQVTGQVQIVNTQGLAAAAGFTT